MLPAESRCPHCQNTELSSFPILPGESFISNYRNRIRIQTQKYNELELETDNTLSNFGYLLPQIQKKSVPSGLCHRIALAVGSLNLLGKCFSLDGNNKLEAPMRISDSRN
jgi:hypothetical protein